MQIAWRCMLVACFLFRLAAGMLSGSAFVRLSQFPEMRHEHTVGFPGMRPAHNFGSSPMTTRRQRICSVPVASQKMLSENSESEESPALRRLAELASPCAHGEGTLDEAVRTAVAGITLADFGAAAAGWTRCYRSTRIVLKVRFLHALVDYSL